jgi:methyl-accepting chemotaxis protein
MKPAPRPSLRPESAATSDHVASSSQELAGMAEQLNELVAKFTL